ncbi:MAG: hypothetical protein ABI855_12435 [Bacteroidota bacterium]
MKKNFSTIVLIVIMLKLSSCTYDSKQPEPNTTYPPDVEKIIATKCATSGCHTDQSKNGAEGLSQQTWTKLFEGGDRGAAVIPYRPDFSTLLYYTNTDSTIGISLKPTMPYNSASLSTSEYNILKNWIVQGAPDKNGFVNYSDAQDKTKFYICNSGCDVVTVMDASSGLSMRYIDVGITQDIEAPCMVKISPDNLYWYVIFSSGTVIQKFRVSDNLRIGEITIGSGFWTSLSITSDSKKAFITDEQPNGRILYIDLENLQLLTSYSTGLKYPNETYLNKSGTTLYVTSQQGNYIYKISVTNPLSPLINEVSLETGVPVDYNPVLNPYSIKFSQDETKYYVSCQLTSELRVLQTSNDSLLAIIPVGPDPAKICISKTTPYIIVCCMGVPDTQKKSEIDFINYQTNSFVTAIEAGIDSRGISIDESNKKLYIANRNISGSYGGHHAPVCDGKNGNVTAIDLNTLQLIPNYKNEVSVNPYDITCNR